MSKKKTSSESSARDVRRAKKDSATSSKINVRYVKFTPEEMAYDCPPDTSDPKQFPTITRGEKDWKKFVNFRNGFVRLDPQIREAFPTSESVNRALRALVKQQRNGKSASTRRKSA
jgi:hypothetical protein